MRSRAHTVHEGIVPLEHIGKVALRRLQKLDIAAKLLLYSEQDQDSLEHRLLLLAQILLLLVCIENHADMRRQVRFAAHIKEIPQLIDRQQRMIGKRPRVVNEMLERLDLLIADRQDEVKHTALVRLEGRSDVLEDERRHRMERHDALDDVLRSDACLLHHLLT